MEEILSLTAAESRDASVACPVCGRPARAAVLQKLIARIACRRCHAVWQIAPACR